MNRIAATVAAPAISHPRGVRREASWEVGIDQTCVWKMFWAASVAFVRISAARFIAICASSTVTTALSGSATVPVASACEALEALSWVFSSEEIASVSSPPKPSPAAACGTPGGLGALREPFGGADGQAAAESPDRRDDHLRIDRVEANIDLDVCIAVTSDW